MLGQPKCRFRRPGGYQPALTPVKMRGRCSPGATMFGRVLINPTRAVSLEPNLPSLQLCPQGRRYRAGLAMPVLRKSLRQGWWIAAARGAGAVWDGATRAPQRGRQMVGVAARIWRGVLVWSPVAAGATAPDSRGAVILRAARRRPLRHQLVRLLQDDPRIFCGQWHPLHRARYRAKLGGVQGAQESGRQWRAVDRGR